METSSLVTLLLTALPLGGLMWLLMSSADRAWSATLEALKARQGWRVIHPPLAPKEAPYVELRWPPPAKQRALVRRERDRITLRLELDASALWRWIDRCAIRPALDAQIALCCDQIDASLTIDQWCEALQALDQDLEPLRRRHGALSLLRGVAHPHEPLWLDGEELSREAGASERIADSLADSAALYSPLLDQIAQALGQPERLLAWATQEEHPLELRQLAAIVLTRHDEEPAPEAALTWRAQLWQQLVDQSSWPVALVLLDEASLAQLMPEQLSGLIEALAALEPYDMQEHAARLTSALGVQALAPIWPRLSRHPKLRLALIRGWIERHRQAPSEELDPQMLQRLLIDQLPTLHARELVQALELMWRWEAPWAPALEQLRHAQLDREGVALFIRLYDRSSPVWRASGMNAALSRALLKAMTQASSDQLEAIGQRLVTLGSQETLLVLRDAMTDSGWMRPEALAKAQHALGQLYTKLGAPTAQGGQLTISEDLSQAGALSVAAGAPQGALSSVRPSDHPSDHQDQG